MYTKITIANLLEYWYVKVQKYDIFENKDMFSGFGGLF